MRSPDPNLPEVEIISLLLTGTHPACTELIPRNLPNRALFDREGLLQSARRAEIFVRNHHVRFKISRGNGQTGKAIITSENNELGNNQAELTLTELPGEDITINLNGQYVQKSLTTLPRPQVALETSGPRNPAKLSLPDHDEYIQVMTPIITLS